MYISLAFTNVIPYRRANGTNGTEDGTNGTEDGTNGTEELYNRADVGSLEEILEGI